MIIVKRYKNRKLYNTSDASYLTLSELADMVDAGAAFQVIDNGTKADITKVTMVSILAKKITNNLPSLSETALASAIKNINSLNSSNSPLFEVGV